MRRTIMGMMALCAAMLVARPAYGASATFVPDDGRPPIAIGAEAIGSVVYASIPDLAAALGLAVQSLDDGQRLIVRAGPVQATFIAWTTVAVVDDLPYNLPARIIIRHDEMLAPADQLAELLGGMAPGRLAWRRESHTFAYANERIDLLPLALDVRADGTLFAIRVPADARIEESASEPGWLHLDILGGHADVRAFRSLTPRGAVLEAYAYQHESSARISLRIESGHGFAFARSDSGRTFTVLFRPESTPAETVRPPADAIETDRSRWAIGTVVIDPGHGGRDPGSIGVDGIKEKDVVLGIALRLAERLRRDLRVEVVLTRDADEFVSLRDRGRIAARRGGKLFVSIHANANEDDRVAGVQTFFLSDAETDEARAVARAENAAIRYEENGESLLASEGAAWEDVSEIMAGMASDRFLRESQDLARLVQGKLVAELGTRDLGVHQASFYVMKGTLATMPGVLVEIGHITNAVEARRMIETEYERRAADALFRAIRDFKAKYERDL